MFIDEIVQKITEVYQKGWHELNAGNLSYVLEQKEILSIQNEFYKNKWELLGIEVEGLANEYILITSSGEFFRDIENERYRGLGIVQINDDGTQYRKVWGFEGTNPSSEMPSHLMVLDQKKCKIVYHSHPKHIIAFSSYVNSSKELSNYIWRSAVECAIVFPKGIGYLPWATPGNGEIAKRTAELVREHDAVVWAHHGIFITSDRLNEIDELVFTLDKSCEILLYQLQIGVNALDMVSSDKIKELANSFSVDLNESLLYE